MSSHREARRAGDNRTKRQKVQEMADKGTPAEAAVARKKLAAMPPDPPKPKYVPPPYANTQPFRPASATTAFDDQFEKMTQKMADLNRAAREAQKAAEDMNNVRRAADGAFTQGVKGRYSTYIVMDDIFGQAPAPSNRNTTDPSANQTADFKNWKQQEERREKQEAERWAKVHAFREAVKKREAEGE